MDEEKIREILNRCLRISVDDTESYMQLNGTEQSVDELVEYIRVCNSAAWRAAVRTVGKYWDIDVTEYLEYNPYE